MGRIDQKDWQPRLKAAYEAGYYRTESDRGSQTLIPWAKDIYTEVSNNFPKIEGKSLTNWISELSSKRDLRILEIGGGTDQAMALRILGQHTGIARYIGLQPDYVDMSVLSELSAFPEYQLLNGRAEDLDRLLHTQKFDIIFAHDVAGHLEDPLQLTRHADRLLVSGGVFFMNQVPMYSSKAVELQEAFKNRGTSFALARTPVIDKSGVALVSIALQRKNQPIPVFSPTSPLESFTGGKYISRDYKIER